MRAPPQSLSQLATTFISFISQAIQQKAYLLCVSLLSIEHQVCSITLLLKSYDNSYLISTSKTRDMSMIFDLTKSNFSPIFLWTGRDLHRTSSSKTNFIRFEPPVSCVQGRRPTGLSYRPNVY
jgi:hypothetical protein